MASILGEAQWLIDGVLQGERQALRHVDQWVEPVVLHRAWGLRAHHEDLRQEIRLRLLECFRAGAFRGESSLKSYVQATAKYTCLDALRRDRIRRTEPFEEEQFPTSSDDPRERLDREESLRLCQRVLSLLPPRCREVLCLILVEELSYEEIARRLGLELGTVKSRIARCRDRAVVLRHRMRSGHPSDAVRQTNAGRERGD